MIEFYFVKNKKMLVKSFSTRTFSPLLKRNFIEIIINLICAYVVTFDTLEAKLNPSGKLYEKGIP